MRKYLAATHVLPYWNDRTTFSPYRTPYSETTRDFDRVPHGAPDPSVCD